MKKTLLAVGVLAAFAGSAYADVTVYGRIDAGLQYKTVKVDGAEKTHAFTMDSGLKTGSRLGFKGTEDLGNGMAVGFVLENGYKVDTGVLGGKEDNRLFDREAILKLSGSFGTVMAGRLASMNNDGGSMALGGNLSALGSGGGIVNGHTALFVGNTARYDNMLGYTSPEFAGVTLYAQYGMGATAADGIPPVGSENKSDTERYAALGAKFSAGDLNIVATVDQINKPSFAAAGVTDPKDPMSVNFGANYDFGFAKLFASVQYAKDFAKFAGKDGVVDDGYNLNFGANVPLAGGTLLLNAGYAKADIATDGDHDIDGMTVGARYEYSLSKRSVVYTGLGYTEVNDTKDKKTKTYGVLAGMAHYF